ncbi:GNAT family N-acetyltransferase [Ruminococcus flavefaciens]|uniref:GNAT family N-acetyltransferase n=1 Tax=Ruminococcus flavefaciens TaxID=1265 RepID=UPI0026E99A3A|nr:GNAT family N-acetyltransferase [Ruminococcus flavefaciens]
MEHYGTSPFETERLICRRFEADDWRDMLENWASLPEIQTEYGEPVYTDEAQVKGLLDSYISGYEKPDFYRWAVIKKSSGRNIGQIAFCKVWEEQKTAEIEYCIGRKYWGKGYAGEALAALIAHCFSTLDFDMLEAYHRAENTKSGRVLEKSPMHRTDTVQRFIREGTVPEGEICYCIGKNDDWQIINERSC